MFVRLQWDSEHEMHERCEPSSVEWFKEDAPLCAQPGFAVSVIESACLSVCLFVCLLVCCVDIDAGRVEPKTSVAHI